MTEYSSTETNQILRLRSSHKLSMPHIHVTMVTGLITCNHGNGSSHM